MLTDDDGTIIANAFQDDVTLIRAHARFACAIGRPISPDGSGPITPFATAKWTGASNGGGDETRRASAGGGTSSAGEDVPERRGAGRPPKAATS